MLIECVVFILRSRAHPAQRGRRDEERRGDDLPHPHHVCRNILGIHRSLPLLVSIQNRLYQKARPFYNKYQNDPTFLVYLVQKG